MQTPCAPALLTTLPRPAHRQHVEVTTGRGGVPRSFVRLGGSVLADRTHRRLGCTRLVGRVRFFEKGGLFRFSAFPGSRMDCLKSFAVGPRRSSSVSQSFLSFFSDRTGCEVGRLHKTMKEQVMGDVAQYRMDVRHACNCTGI